MTTILTLPDGSAFDASMVAAINWNRSRPGDYGGKAILRIHVYKEPGGFGISNSRTIEQAHYVEMESDEAAKAACEALVAGWSGRVLKAKTIV